MGAVRLEGHFTQALTADGVARVSVTLTAADVASRTVDLTEAGGMWSGGMEAIPAGEQRTFSATAFDASGTPRYAGQASGITLLAGQTALVALTLQPLSAPPPFTNAVPVIDAVVASVRTVAPGGAVSLQATAHDPNPGDVLTYAWSAPAGTFSAATSAATAWSAPSTPGAVPLTVTVTDSRGASASLGLTLTVHAGTGGADVDVTLNTWPQVASLTATPSTVAPGQSTTLAVTASDADGDALAYQWSAVGCMGTWSGASTATAHFTPSAVPAGGACDCHLGVTVSDGRGGQGKGTLSLCVGPPPTATFPPEIIAASRSSSTAAPGAPITLRVEAADPQGSALGFAWAASLGSLGPPAQGASASEVVWTAPSCTASGNPSITATVSSALGLSTKYTFTFAGLPECFPLHDSWTSIGGLWLVVGHPTATLLPSGQVLVAGGDRGLGWGASLGTGWSHLYDPETGLGSMTGFMNDARSLHTASVLPSGQVLVAGGGTDKVDLYTPATGTWSPTGPLSTERADHSATVLPSGKVLVVGGHSMSLPVLVSAELYTPATGTWSPAAAPSVGHRGHTATVLSSGKVLVAGGGTSVAELYDPATGTWSPTGSLGAPRRDHAAVLLTSGKVLVLGGRGGADEAVRTAELYDPATGTWSPTGGLGADHVQVPAVLLTSGKVLVAGGGSAVAELYEPATGTWKTTAPMLLSRQSNVLVPLPSGKVLVLGGVPLNTAVEVFDPVLEQWTSRGAAEPNRAYVGLTLLPSGKVLASGGRTPAHTSFHLHASASLYDPASRSWSPTGSLHAAREAHTQTLLPSGKVLVAGGRVSYSSPLNTVELYDPSTGTWSPASPMAQARALHTAVLLPSGKVLVVGGGKQALPELYDPATNTWTSAGASFPSDLFFILTATLLPSGKVLVTGGWDAKGPAELYDPATGTWSPTGAQTSQRSEATATLLPSGKVLVAGGVKTYGYADPHLVDVYDPDTGTWSAAKNILSDRAEHRAQLLPSGEVLLVGTSALDYSASLLYTP